MRKPLNVSSIEVKDVVAVLGPTASGKSSLAEHLARQFRGELVNSDASAFYRELSTGVTKPDSSIRREIPHHLLDLTTLEGGFDLAEFLPLAENALQNIVDRERLPIVVGGSGLYARALLDGFRPHTIPVSDSLRRQVRALDLPEALEQLEERDPDAFARIDRNNPRRVHRALELALANGGPVPPAQKRPPKNLRIMRFYLHPSKAVLDRRIRERTLQMWEPWLEEVDQLEKKGLLRWLDLRKPIGYSVVLAFTRGQMSRTEAIDEIVRQTVKLAKKQRTWLKKEAKHPFCHHFVLESEEQWDSVPEVAEERLREFLGLSK